MSDDLSPRQRRRQRKLLSLLTEHGGPAEVARITGVQRSHLSAMKAGTRGMGDELAARLERAFELPEGWFDQEEPAWPFRIELVRFLALSPEDQAYVEGKLESAIEGCEAATNSGTQQQTDGPVTGRTRVPARFPGEVVSTGRGKGNTGAVSQPGELPAKRGSRRA